MIKKEAYYGDNLTRSAVSVGEYKKTEEYKTNPLEETTKYYVLKDYPGYKEILNDPKLVRMLGRVHQIINAEIRDVDFENIASTGDYGQETVDILEKAYIDLLINAWNKSDQFAKLDNLFNVFKHPPKDTKQRDRREKAAADELYGFLKLVANKEHAKSAQVRDGKIYNDFPSGKWDYPASTYQNSNN